MRRAAFIGLGVLLALVGPARAQSSSLDALEAELKEAKQMHQDMSAQALSNFFAQIDAAMGDPATAIQLYQQAGGIMPDPAPVTSEHETETPTEREARLAQDQATQKSLGTILQLHCGFMHFAAMFVTKPDQKGLQEDWMAWLQKAAQAYPQLNVPLPGAADPNPAPGQHRKKKEGGGGGGKNAFNPDDIMSKSMKDSLISKYLNFKLWGDKEQAGWSVRQLPKIYRSTVLEPLRAKPSANTLAAWDVYIAMANADEKDPEKWQQVDYPPLQFDRACDDYSATPSTEKLEGLVGLIKANPTFPQADDWISRVKQFMDDYRASHGGKPSTAQGSGLTAPSTSPANSNVIVTTHQEGDATIITTHTNAAPGAPAPPP